MGGLLSDIPPPMNLSHLNQIPVEGLPRLGKATGWIYLYDNYDDPCNAGGWSGLASEVFIKILRDRLPWLILTLGVENIGLNPGGTIYDYYPCDGYVGHLASIIIYLPGYF